MNGQEAAGAMREERMHLQNILKDFRADHEDFCPAKGTMTVAQQINHIARTVSWFREGAFGSGFDMDLEKFEAANHERVTLAEALARLDREYNEYEAFLAPLSEAELAAPMPPNPIFGEASRLAVLVAQMDHTAHHRGALSVYLRLLGITPALIYGE